jgi:hypothetical protein
VKLTAFMQFVFLICNDSTKNKDKEYDDECAKGGGERDIQINNDRLRVLLLKRIMAYRAQPRECWGDYFSGVGAEEARAAAALRAPAGSGEEGGIGEGLLTGGTA